MEEKVIIARKAALCIYMKDFLEQEKIDGRQDIQIDIETSAGNICDLYDRYVEEIIRPAVTSGIIQNYKIIAFTELAVLRVQPISFADEDELSTASYNAELALHIGINFLLDWHNIDPKKFRELIEKDGQLDTFLTEHKNWLATLDSRYYFPGFSNSQVWRLFHYLVGDRIQNIR